MKMKRTNKKQSKHELKVTELGKRTNKIIILIHCTHSYNVQQSSKDLKISFVNDFCFTFSSFSF